MSAPDKTPTEKLTGRIYARIGGEGLRAAREVANLLVQMGEALKRIAAETEGIPEMSCEIAQGLANEGLAAYEALMKEGE